MTGDVPAGTSVTTSAPRFDRADALVALAQRYNACADRAATSLAFSTRHDSH